MNFSLYSKYYREPRTQFNTSDHAGANCWERFWKIRAIKRLMSRIKTILWKTCRNWFRSLMCSHLGWLKLQAQIILNAFLIICCFVSPPVSYYVWQFGFLLFRCSLWWSGNGAKHSLCHFAFGWPPAGTWHKITWPQKLHFRGTYLVWLSIR